MSLPRRRRGPPRSGKKSKDTGQLWEKLYLKWI